MKRFIVVLFCVVLFVPVVSIAEVQWQDVNCPAIDKLIADSTDKDGSYFNEMDLFALTAISDTCKTSICVPRIKASGKTWVVMDCKLVGDIKTKGNKIIEYRRIIRLPEK